MGKSSKDKRDAYYRLAKEQGWRARSAFKLLQLDEEFNLFEGVSRVVDLCAAPGSWSQVLSRVLVKGEKFGRASWNDKLDKVQAAVRGEDVDAPAAKEENGIDGDDKTSSPDDTVPPDEEKTTPRKDVKIVAIDLQPMSPLEGITQLRADITAPSTIPLILHALDPLTNPSPTTISPNAQTSPVDLILSDGAPDVTGLHDLDIYIQSQLIYAALSLCIQILKPGGVFVAKIFRGKDVDLLFAQMRLLFRDVVVAKPRSSRASSVEAFIVCRGFVPPRSVPSEGEALVGSGGVIVPAEEMEQPKKTEARRTVREDGITELELGEDGEEGNGGWGEDGRRDARWIAPFLACGDLNSYDADATYHLPAGHVSLDPVQPPTSPPYKRALEMRRAAGGAYGKTKKGK